MVEDSFVFRLVGGSLATMEGLGVKSTDRLWWARETSFLGLTFPVPIAACFSRNDRHWLVCHFPKFDSLENYKYRKAKSVSLLVHRPLNCVLVKSGAPCMKFEPENSKTSREISILVFFMQVYKTIVFVEIGKEEVVLYKHGINLMLKKGFSFFFFIIWFGSELVRDKWVGESL